MTQPPLFDSSDQPATISQATTRAEQRANALKAEAESAAKEAGIWQKLQTYQVKGRWFHLRALLERESNFFRGVRESNAPVIEKLEELFLDAKKRTEDMIHDMPRDIEQMAKTHGLPLDLALSTHPKYQFCAGFLTLEIDDVKRIARLKDYEKNLGNMLPDIDVIAQAITHHEARLFGRVFDGPKFLEKIRRAYSAILKKEKRVEGEAVPLREIAHRLADNEKSFRRDEFLIDLSRLSEKGPAEIGGYRFEFQQTKDINQGFLLYGPSCRGMVNLLIFRKVAT